MVRSLARLLRRAAVPATDLEIKALRPMAVAMRRIEPYAVEVALSTASAWAGWCLWQPGDYWKQFPQSYALMSHMRVADIDWAVFCFTAAALKLVGIMLIKCPRCGWLSMGLRCSGLAASLVFWSVLSLSIFLGSASISGGTDAVLALTAMWTLLRLPLLPGEK